MVRTDINVVTLDVRRRFDSRRVNARAFLTFRCSRLVNRLYKYFTRTGTPAGSKRQRVLLFYCHRITEAIGLLIGRAVLLLLPDLVVVIAYNSTLPSWSRDISRRIFSVRQLGLSLSLSLSLCLSLSRSQDSRVMALVLFSAFHSRLKTHLLHKSFPPQSASTHLDCLLGLYWTGLLCSTVFHFQLFFIFCFGSCGRLSWLNCHLSSSR